MLHYKLIYYTMFSKSLQALFPTKHDKKLKFLSKIPSGEFRGDSLWFFASQEKSEDILMKRPWALSQFYLTRRGIGYKI